MTAGLQGACWVPGVWAGSLKLVTFFGLAKMMTKTINMSRPRNMNKSVGVEEATQFGAVGVEEAMQWSNIWVLQPGLGPAARFINTPDNTELAQEDLTATDLLALARLFGHRCGWTSHCRPGWLCTQLSEFPLSLVAPKNQWCFVVVLLHIHIIIYKYFVASKLESPNGICTTCILNKNNTNPARFWPFNTLHYTTWHCSALHHTTTWHHTTTT